jgi:hypothetical protein
MDDCERSQLISLMLSSPRPTFPPQPHILSASGAVLDMAAVLAFVAWSVIEVIVVAALAIFRREPA